MIYCQDCGAANDVAGTFCRICGRNLSPGARIAPLPNVQSATRQSSRVLLLVWRRGDASARGPACPQFRLRRRGRRWWRNAASSSSAEPRRPGDQRELGFAGLVETGGDRTAARFIPGDRWQLHVHRRQSGASLPPPMPAPQLAYSPQLTADPSVQLSQGPQPQPAAPWPTQAAPPQGSTSYRKRPWRKQNKQPFRPRRALLGTHSGRLK